MAAPPAQTLSALWTPDGSAARLFVRAAAPNWRAWARPAAGGWACGLGEPPPGAAAGRRVEAPFERLGEAAEAGILLRLAGLPATAAEAVGAGEGWRWARVNLPAPAVEPAPDLSGGVVLSGAAQAARGARFLAGVEGDCFLERAILAPDAGAAAWLAAGAASAGVPAFAELGEAKSDAAGRWAAEAGLPARFLSAPREERAALRSMPRTDAGMVPANTPRPRPMAALAEVRPADAFLDGPAGPLARALAAAAAPLALGPEDLVVYSSAGRLEGLACLQASGLGDGAAPAAAGARLADPARWRVAVAGPLRGAALGWAAWLAERNADLTLVTAGLDAAARAALEAAGLPFLARLRPQDGPGAAAALEAALRARGLAVLVLDAASPSAVLKDSVRFPSWEEVAGAGT